MNTVPAQSPEIPVIENLKRRAEEIRLERTNDFLFATYLSVLSTTPQLEKLTSWGLLAVGATAGLMITNIESITRVLGQEVFKLIVSLLLISALCGFASIFRGFLASRAFELWNQLIARSAPVFEKRRDECAFLEYCATSRGVEIDTGLNIEHIRTQFVKTVPWFLRWSAKRNFKIGSTDTSRTLRVAVTSAIWQAIWASLQFTFYLIVLYVAGSYVASN